MAAELGPATHAGLVAALADLEGTELDEQVEIAATGGGLLDVAHQDEGDGGHFMVYVEMPAGPPLAERGVPMPPGTEIIDETGGTATVELGPLSAADAADVLEAWAAALFPASLGPVHWSATQDT